MRRPLVRQVVLAARGSGARPAARAIAHPSQFTPQRGQLVGQLKHGLVLFGHMPLEVGDFFLEALEAIIHGAEGFGRALSSSISGITTRW